ncbi:MAG: hypothetical protein AB1610_10640 [Nitrospirota bacterium]
MIKDSKLFAVVLLCSCSSLAYEIVLIRIFSISLWYHFAFMIISIAMLGIGASGTLLSLYPKLKNLSNIGIYSLLLGSCISVSYICSNQIPFDPVKLSWSRMQILYIGIYYMVLSIPFFFAGLVVAAVFSSASKKAGLFYGADLVGAGIGSIGVLSLMFITAPDKVVFIISVIALSAAFIAGEKKLKFFSLSLIILIIFLLISHPSFINLKMSPYKGLQVALKYPGAEHLKTYFSPFARVDTLKSPAVRFAPGLSLRYLDAIPEQIGFSIDGGELNAITSSGDQKSLEFLRHLPSALPYEVANSHSRGFSEEKGNVLILDPRGGLQCLIAEYYGFPNTYKIEGNPLLINIIRSDFNEFSGGIYSQNTWTGFGRGWLKYNKRNFDIIDIPLMGATPSASFGVSEDYKLTVEAFKEYLYHLKPNGILSVNLFILPPPRMELRVVNTVITAMEELGIKDTRKNIAAIRSWGSICILIKKSSFSLDEIGAIKKFSERLRFDLIYYPGIKEEETNVYIRMPSNEYFTAFKNILNSGRKQFIDSYIFDVKPVRDENPFFHYYLKLKNIKAIYKIMGEKWQFFIEEGYILPLVFVQVLFLSLVLIFLPVFAKKHEDIHSESPHIPLSKRGGGRRFLPYFALLGTGFMFVEISLVQKMIFPLENPSYAVATVLTSILISSGIGSMLSYKIAIFRGRFIPLIISLLIVGYSMFIPYISAIISPYSISVKIFLLFFVLMPLGLFMGIPFPTGLKILGERDESLIPWAWAINGCLSVLAPILTIMIALSIGFKFVLWLGALAYVFAFVSLRGAIKA